MQLKIDHVTIAGSRLEDLQQAFAEVGLVTDYGGPHSNNITHMSLLGFDDGSYIELISTLEPRQTAPWWDAHIKGNGGPCAWAIDVDDVAEEARRASAAGIHVDGPRYYARERPDGRRIEWDLAVLGDQGMGAVLPFIIKDRTPRRLRVSPSASVTGSELTGVGMVVLGITDLERAATLFTLHYDLPSPPRSEIPGLAASGAYFGRERFMLAAPLKTDDWLAKRLARFGPSPCAYLIGSRDFARSVERFRLADQEIWWGRHVAWFASNDLRKLRIGIISL
jgi:hypothetical protein